MGDYWPPKLEIRERSPFGKYETYGLTAHAREVKRIKDLSDANVNNQFDWKAYEEEQGHGYKKTMINLWFACK